MAAAELDCDVCGLAVDPEHLYQLAVTHGNLREEFEFCSMRCLSRWTKQYLEDQRRTAAAELEQSLAADGEEVGETDAVQDLEEEIEEHDAIDAPAPQSYGRTGAQGVPEDTSYEGEEPYQSPKERTDILSELEQSAPVGGIEVYDQSGKPSPTPVSDFIEEMDPVERQKREREDLEERERKRVQEDSENAKSG